MSSLYRRSCSKASSLDAFEDELFGKPECRGPILQSKCRFDTPQECRGDVSHNWRGSQALPQLQKLPAVPSVLHRIYTPNIALGEDEQAETCCFDSFLNELLRQLQTARQLTYSGTAVVRIE